MRRLPLLPLLVFAALVAAVVWLRAPTFGHRVWNLDEAIHATVARELLHGGVLYRDAIDQRTPLTYYVVAAVFAVAGENNLFALHVFTALVIAATGFLLWRAGVAWRHAGAGGWAAALYVTLSSSLLFEGDAYAFNTEWMLALFTAAGALLSARAAAARSARGHFAAGAMFGLAFLSKQPALLDLAAPVAALAYIAWRDPAERRSLAGRLLALAGGALAPVALAALYFAACGALGDAVRYAWLYNLNIYGPEIPFAGRLASITRLGDLFAPAAPVLLAWIGLAGLTAALRLVQRSPTPAEHPENGFTAFVFAWSVSSVGGALSGGRGFDHYYIQCLPALFLLAGWLLARAGRTVFAAHRPLALRAMLGLLLAATVFDAGDKALASRHRSLPVDNSLGPAQFIRERTAPEERIFVWGYHPEFYLYSERRSASRFVYASFLTGLVPWTNIASGRDTAYAIVPGAMETLLRELDERRPAFFVDCSAGPNRFWQKYPLGKFPALKAFVDAHYVRADPDQFHGQGYDLYILRDTARRAPLRPSASSPAQLAAPHWFGPTTFTDRGTAIIVTGTSAGAQLTGLDLLIDGAVHTGVSFAPVAEMKFAVTVHLDERQGGTRTLHARARGADGSALDSPAIPIRVVNGLLPEEMLAAFPLPRMTDPLLPLFVQTPFAASAEMVEGQPTFFAHAPSTLAFALPPQAVAVEGGFGFRAQAHGADNPSPTDGAEFRIELVGADGQRRLLFSRLLRPTLVETDRGVHSFRVVLPGARDPDDRLEFVITAGMADSAASDWTFWKNLRLETSR